MLAGSGGGNTDSSANTYCPLSVRSLVLSRPLAETNKPKGTTDPALAYPSSKDCCQRLLPWDGGNTESGEEYWMGALQSESQGEKRPPPMAFHRIVTRSNKTVCDYPHFTGEETERETAGESCPRSRVRVRISVPEVGSSAWLRIKI